MTEKAIDAFLRKSWETPPLNDNANDVQANVESVLKFLGALATQNLNCLFEAVYSTKNREIAEVIEQILGRRPTDFPEVALKISTRERCVRDIVVTSFNHAPSEQFWTIRFFHKDKFIGPVVYKSMSLQDALKNAIPFPPFNSGANNEG